MKQRWAKGDVFLVENSDRLYTPGQILGLETRTLRCAACAFFDQRIADPSAAGSLHLDADRCFASLLVTPDGLDAGVWPVVGHQSVALASRHYPFARVLRIRGFLRLIGLERSLLTRNLPNATIRGSGIVDDFLNAFYGLRAWDDWSKPDYLDTLLLSPAKKPERLILVKSTSHVQSDASGT